MPLYLALILTIKLESWISLLLIWLKKFRTRKHSWAPDSKWEIQCSDRQPCISQILSKGLWFSWFCFNCLVSLKKKNYNKNYNQHSRSYLFMERHSFIHNNSCSDAKHSEGIWGLGRIEIILPEEKEPKHRLTIKK